MQKHVYSDIDYEKIKAEFKATTISGKYYIEGSVFDVGTNRPIQSVGVYISGKAFEYIQNVETDVNGRIKFLVQKGIYQVDISPTFQSSFKTELTIPFKISVKEQEREVGIKKIPYTISNSDKIKAQFKLTEITGKYYIEGSVSDVETNRPIQSVIYILNSASGYTQSTETNLYGRFKFPVPEGSYEVDVSPTFQSPSKTLLSVSPKPKDEPKNVVLALPQKVTISKPAKEVSGNKELSSESHIEGTVIDRQTKEFVEYAQVRLLHRSGQYVKGAETDKYGSFKIALQEGNYSLDVSYLGYKTSRSTVVVSPTANSDLGKIFLEPDYIMLSEAVVVAKIPDIRVKGDTIEYNAKSYMKKENAVLQDILKRIPGASLTSEGHLTINNKPVYKILIDGKEFFGNDIEVALKNIPAEIVEKLQVYNEESELTKITGFRDSEGRLILNLVLEEQYKESIFGNAQAGYGSNKRYYTKGMVNYLGKEKHMTVLGVADNINSEDDNIYFSEESGVKSSKDIGVNFNYDKINNLQIESNLQVSGISKVLETTEDTQYIIPSENRRENDKSKSKKSETNTKIGTNLTWDNNSAVTAFLRINAEHKDIKENSFEETVSYTNQSDTTTSWSDYSSKGDKNSLGANLTVGMKLNEKGRNVSLSLQGALNQTTKNGSNLSATKYTASFIDKSLDQRLHEKDRSSAWSSTLSYVEPITKNSLLMLSYSYNANKSKHNQNVLRNDGANNYNIVDSAYTRLTRTNYNSQIISIGYQMKKDKYEYMARFNLEPTKSTGNIYLLDSLLQKIEQNVVNYNGTFNFIYRPQKDAMLNISYSASANQPTVDQLSSDTIILNPLYKTYGNPDLKTSLNNNLSIQYQKSDIESGRFFMLSGGVNFTSNKIAGYSIIDELGNTTSTYRNVNGNWGASLSNIINIPLNDKFTIDNTINAAHYRNVGYINDTKNIIKNLNIAGSLSVNYSSDILESRLVTDYVYNTIRSSLQNQANMNISNFSVSNISTIELPFDIELMNNIGFSSFSGYSGNFNNSQVLWNASLSKQFLKKKKALFEILLYDILNEKKNVSRSLTNSQITDIRTNSINQYFMFRLTYRFNR